MQGTRDVRAAHDALHELALEREVRPSEGARTPAGCSVHGALYLNHKNIVSVLFSLLKN